MNAVEYAKVSINMSDGWIMGLIADMKDAPLTAPTPNGGNHPLWCLGHLAYSEGNLIHKFCMGKENPVADWAEVFAERTTVSNNADDYPPFDEVMAKAQEIRAGTNAYIDSLSESDLDNPSHAPEEMAEYFGTVGQCLAAMPVHIGFHGGQVADARRAAGREPLMG